MRPGLAETADGGSFGRGDQGVDFGGGPQSLVGGAGKTCVQRLMVHRYYGLRDPRRRHTRPPRRLHQCSAYGARCSHHDCCTTTTVLN